MAAVREELLSSPTIAHVIFALRGASSYAAFAEAIAGAPADSVMSGASPESRRTDS